MVSVIGEITNPLILTIDPRLMNPEGRSGFHPQRLDVSQVFGPQDVVIWLALA